MDCSKYLILLSLFLFIYSQTSSAQTLFRPSALVLPVTKDSATGQYVVDIKQRTPLIPVKLTIDLNGESLWVDCTQGYVSSSYKASRCGSAPCSLANGKGCSYCSSDPKPGCNNSCALNLYNPFVNFYSVGDVGQDLAALQFTDIDIGAHQIEDHLLQFDLATSRLGFSNLLLGQLTTCGNFNFTSVA